MSNRLFLSGNRAPGEALPGIDVVVSVARECPIVPGTHPTKLVEWFSLVDDGPPDEAAVVLAAEAARVVVAHLRDRNVLVHCQAGQNRSAWVVAQALMLLGHSSKEALQIIRHARPNSFSNEFFYRRVQRL